jgi:hypothetical protein
MALDANQIVNAYRQLDREQLFSLNIRNFIGNTVTNRRIIQTAINSPESFTDQKLPAPLNFPSPAERWHNRAGSRIVMDGLTLATIASDLDGKCPA